MIKNNGPILCSDVGALPIQSRRIVIGPENIEQIVVFNLRRIEFNLHHFRVAGLVGANVLVTGILFRSAGVADRGRGYAFEISKSLFHAPETTRPERRFLSRHNK